MAQVNRMVNNKEYILYTHKPNLIKRTNDK